MSFIFEDHPTFEWPVRVSVPVNGGHEVVEFNGLFNQIPDSEYFADVDANKPSEAIEAEIARLLEVFAGWTDGAVTTRDGANVEPTEENRRRFLAQRPNRMAVSEAYRDAISPVAGVRAKNSGARRV